MVLLLENINKNAQTRDAGPREPPPPQPTKIVKTLLNFTAHFLGRGSHWNNTDREALHTTTLFLGDLRWVARFGLMSQISVSQIEAPIGSLF